MFCNYFFIIKNFCSYLRPAQVGSNLVFDASLTKKGKQMAFMEIAIKEKESGKVIATGSHTKYMSEKHISIVLTFNITRSLLILNNIFILCISLFYFF